MIQRTVNGRRTTFSDDAVATGAPVRVQTVGFWQMAMYGLRYSPSADHADLYATVEAALGKVGKGYKGGNWHNKIHVALTQKECETVKKAKTLWKRAAEEAAANHDRDTRPIYSMDLPATGEVVARLWTEAYTPDPRAYGEMW